MDYKIGETIIEDGIKEFDNYKTRNTVRAVIIKDNKVLMLYSKMFDDYTFPGGGVKDYENKEEALKRELKEEVGANSVNVVKYVGHTLEYRYGINSSNNIYLQKSDYYLCEIADLVEPKYVGREKEQGLEIVYVDPSEIIIHNNKINEKRIKSDNKGFQTVLIRENQVLDHILKELMK